MILFSGHKEFTYRGNEYEFIGEITAIGNESSYTGILERIEWDEDNDCEKRVPDDNYSADELIDMMEIKLPLLYFLEIKNT